MSKGYTIYDISFPISCTNLTVISSAVDSQYGFIESTAVTPSKQSITVSLFYNLLYDTTKDFTSGYRALTIGY